MGQSEIDGLQVPAHAVGSGQAVPEREDGGIIGVGFLRDPRVMDFVHVGRDKQPTIAAIQPAQRDIGVVQLGGEEDQDAVEDELPGLQSEQGDQQQTQECGDAQFTPVKAGGCGDVHVGVAVVHAMESPEEGNLVVHPVPAEHPGVEEQDGANGLPERAQWQLVEQPPLMCLSPAGGRLNNGAKQEPEQQRVEDCQCQIMQCVSVAVLSGKRFEGSPAFPAPEQCQQHDGRAEIQE